MNVRQKDLYKILGVIDSAELVVIKAAYKALMMMYHPDRSDGNKEEAIRKAKELNEAYAILTDPDKRRKYDMDRPSSAFKSGEKSEDDLRTKKELKKSLAEIKTLLKEFQQLVKTLSH